MDRKLFGRAHSGVAIVEAMLQSGHRALYWQGAEEFKGSWSGWV